MFHSTKRLSIGLIAKLIVILGMATVFSTAASASAFNTMLGSWGGNGIFELKSGKKERIKCTAYYTGNASQLKMNIRCKGTSKIEMRSTMSMADGKIVGTWLETTFNAEGNIKGKTTGRKMRLNISGAVTGTIEVLFSKVRQQVKIDTKGTDLKAVNITLTRR